MHEIEKKNTARLAAPAAYNVIIAAVVCALAHKNNMKR